MPDLKNEPVVEAGKGNWTGGSISFHSARRALALADHLHECFVIV
jgi:hypothetical protein